MLRNKNILVITPFFPPQSHAAVFRAYKLVKYLKRAGWNPVVLTVDTNYLYQEDKTLLDDIENVTIYRAQYIEPTIRGLKYKLFRIDTTYKKISSTNSNDNIQIKKTTSSRIKTNISRLYFYLLKRWIQVPDRFVGWYPFAMKLAKKIIRNHDISIIYTTCLPFTCNKLGIELRKSMDVKWIADFRDPITYAKRMYSDYLQVYVKQKQIEINTFKYADAIVGLSSSYLHIFNDLYMGKYDYKCYFIPTGVDDDYLPNIDIKKDNSIIFIGEYLREYKDSFLKMFKKCIDMGVECRLKVVGNVDINRRAMQPFINALKLSNQVDYINYMPQRELYKLIKQSKAAVLIPGKKAHWWNNFAKLVDYIALQIPVIAMVPDISEAKSELSKAGLGFFLDENDTEKLYSLLKNGVHLDTINYNYCKRYLASSQVESFINIFNKL